jgi:hypothetical protein
MSVWYLELDDEITDAVARLRAAKDDRVVFVVPAGSRIGTGRINFRLLAREALSRDLRIALVSGDAQVRALAASAGLPTYASVGESERGAASEGPLTLDVEPPSPGEAEGTGSTAIITTAPGPGAGKRSASNVVRRPRSRRRKAAMTAGVLGLVAIVGGGALWAVYQSVPTARIILALAPRAFGPRQLAIAVTASEPTSVETGTVQGQLRPVTATGQVVVTPTDPVNLSQRASGTVTFSNATDTPVPVQERTIVATPDGVQFETQFVIDGVPAHGTADVAVRAVDQGTKGNVPAGTITLIQDATLAAQLGDGGGVTNAAPTAEGQDSGTSKRFTQADFDAAVTALGEQLAGALPDARPEVDADTVVFPDTTQRTGDVHVNEDPTVIVGTVAGTDDPPTMITGDLEGNVLTVSNAALVDIATRMLAASASPDSLVSDPTIDLGVPIVQGGRATYAATGEGAIYGLTIPMGDLKQELRSKTIQQAQDILGEYGTATITLSPDFLPNLPDDPNRIDLQTESPPPGAMPAPMTSPASSPSPGASPPEASSPVPSIGSSAGPSPLASTAPTTGAIVGQRAARISAREARIA